MRGSKREYVRKKTVTVKLLRQLAINWEGETEAPAIRVREM